MKFEPIFSIFWIGVIGLVMACACTQEATPLARDSRGVSSLTPPGDAAEKPEDEPEEAPDETIKGYFVLNDNTRCIDTYLHFDKGVMSIYTLKSGVDKPVFYDGWLWDTNGTDRFNRTDTGKYKVDGETLYFKGDVYGALTLTSNTLKLAGKDYTLCSGFKAGNVLEAYASQAVDLSKDPANCYIVSKAGFYKFSPYTRKRNHIDGVARAELLWCSFGTNETPKTTDLISAVWYKNDYVYFAALPSYLYGNAGIAVKDAFGKILWSWHIWLCKGFDPVQKAQTYYSGAVMMDRNLGATSIVNGDPEALGLLYQWGRKDPFLGSCSITECIPAASTGIWSVDRGYGDSKHIEQPMTVFAPKGNPANPFSSFYDFEPNWGAEVDSWEEPTSMYDPCPPDWHVPYGGGNGVWAQSCGATGYSSCGYDELSNTNYFNSIFSDASRVAYPLAGYLNWKGELENVGSMGRYWTCLSYDRDHAYDLLLYRQHYQSVENTNMATACSVRCCKD